MLLLNQYGLKDIHPW